jgi:hypothetical protein
MFFSLPPNVLFFFITKCKIIDRSIMWWVLIFYINIKKLTKSECGRPTYYFILNNNETYVSQFVSFPFKRILFSTIAKVGNFLQNKIDLIHLPKVNMIDQSTILYSLYTRNSWRLGHDCGNQGVINWGLVFHICP